IVVFGDGKPRFRFLKTWNRARTFGREGIGFLRDFAQQAASLQMGIFSRDDLADERVLRQQLGRWHNSIQFSEPRGSLKAPEAFLQEVAGTFLHESATRKGVQKIVREQAVSLATKAVQEAVVGRFGPGASRALVKRRYEIDGKLEKHSFDLAIANGTL